jgi:Protein of unknown function (DUF664)
VSLPFPAPTIPVSSRAEVFLGYLDYFRSRLVSKLKALPGDELRRGRLPSGWTPIELLKHLAYVELRWMEWGFEGRDVADPWGDRRDDRWHVAPGETLEELVAALHQQAARTRAVVESYDLADIGQPGERWVEQIRRPWSGSCSTCSRSTRATSATSTSSASWLATGPGSNLRSAESGDFRHF